MYRNQFQEVKRNQFLGFSSTEVLQWQVEVWTNVTQGQSCLTTAADKVILGTSDTSLVLLGLAGSSAHFWNKALLVKQLYQIHDVTNNARISGNHTRHYDGPSPADPRTGTAAGSANREANPQLMPITDIRSLLFQPSPAFTLDTHGFTVIKHPSALLFPPYTRDSWNNASLLESIHYPEIEQVVKDQTGAKTVLILGGTARARLFREPERRPTPAPVPEGTVLPNTNKGNYPAFTANRPRVHGFDKGQEQGPAKKPHIDFGVDGARATLRNWRQDIADEGRDIIAAEKEAEALPGGLWENYKGRRWGVFWDLETKDLVSYFMRPPGIHGQYETDIKLAKASQKHKWYWCKDQQPDELTILKFWDSESEKPGSKIAGGIPHTSFHLEGTDDLPPRESLEVSNCILVECY
ncbi:hypothetical protein V8E51_001270 [Hyaloscypha variabilis]